ncbi:MAG: hypothetical protein ABH827_02150 [bacterium]
MTKQIHAINTRETKKSERTCNQFAILCFLVSFTSFIFTPLAIASEIKVTSSKKEPNRKNNALKKKRRKKTTKRKRRTYKKNTRKHNPNLLKNIQKRPTISIGYAEIKAKRMLTKARVAKKDHASLSTSIIKQARTHMQKNRVDRNKFNDLVKKEIKTHKKSKKNLTR